MQFAGGGCRLLLRRSGGVQAVPRRHAFVAFGLTAVFVPGDETVKAEVDPALKAFQVDARLLAALVEDHWVRFYASFDHEFESIPDAIPGFLFVKADEHVSPDV